MAVATVFWLPSNIEPFFWLAIFIACAYIIARRCGGRYFLHGFLTSLANCVWITSLHIIFSKTYLANHPQAADMMSKMPMHDHPQLVMLLMGPVIGILSGLILGLFSFIAGKLVRKAVDPVLPG